MKKKGENEHEEIVEVPVFLNESDSMKTRKRKDKNPQINVKTSDLSDIKLWDDEEDFITYHLNGLGLKSPPRVRNEKKPLHINSRTVENNQAP